MIKQQSDQGFVPWGRKTDGKLLARLSVLILALIPLIILILNVIEYHVDVPFWDQWNFVPLLGKSYEQGVTLEDLWSQHNEHRLFFPRLFMLGLAHASRYNIAWELVLILLLATATFALLWYQFFRTAGALGARGLPWAVPVFALLVFTLGQAENWLWGWQIQIFLSILAVVAGLFLLGSQHFRWGNLWGALGAGIVATYSFANGLLFWPLGFFSLFLASPENKRRRRQALALWAIATVSVAVSYLYRFRYKSPSGTPWTEFVKHPGEYVKYVLIYLGRPIINYQEYALAVGLAGFILFGFLSLYMLMKKRAEIQAFLPFILIGLYSVGCGLLTGIGRVGFGSRQAMDGRYVPFSALIWISSFALLFLSSQEVRAGTKSRAGRILVSAGLAVMVSFLVFWIGRTSYRVGHRVFKSHHSWLLPARQELRRGEDTELLLRLYIDADYVRRGIEILKKHNLSVFR